MTSTMRKALNAAVASSPGSVRVHFSAQDVQDAKRLAKGDAEGIGEVERPVVSGEGFSLDVTLSWDAFEGVNRAKVNYVVEAQPGTKVEVTGGQEGVTHSDVVPQDGVLELPIVGPLLRLSSATLQDAITAFVNVDWDTLRG